MMAKATDIKGNIKFGRFSHIQNVFPFSDGLVDCADSNCCGHPSCTESIMCVFLADPVDVLLRKPPPSVSASFFQVNSLFSTYGIYFT